MSEDTAIQKVEFGFQTIEKMGACLAKSGLFNMKTPEQATALCLIAMAEGRHPASAAMDYHSIQNRPALRADALLARFQAAGGSVKWHEYTDSKVSGTFSHPQGGQITVDWDLARAKQAGLGAKDNWKNYPRAMLRARVISEGIRTVYPGVLGGMYTPEEVMEFAEPEQKSLPPAPSTHTVDPFDTFISELNLDEREVDLLNQYMDGRVAVTGKSLETIKHTILSRKDYQTKFVSELTKFFDSQTVMQQPPSERGEADVPQ
jgi:hypothetical protein